MTSFLYSFFAFLVAIIILVTVHEFGHFWVARRMGVKVLRFSVGFGKTLFSWTDKLGTEYVIAAVPIGGYVKMLDENEGEVPKDQLHLAFNRQAIRKRVAVVVAGPLFNFLFAILAYALMFMVGVKTLVPVVGEPPLDSIAAMAGLHDGDEITAIDNIATPDWQAVRLQLLALVGREGAANFSVRNIKTSNRSTVELDLTGWEIGSDSNEMLSSLGLAPYMPSVPPIVGRVLPDLPAEIAGLKAGDEILSMDGVTINDWHSVVSYIKVKAGKKVKLGLRRDGRLMTVSIQPKEVELEGGERSGFIGVEAQPFYLPKELVRDQSHSLTGAWWPAVKQTVHMSLLTFKVLGKMVMGHVSPRSLSGPIGIAQGAGMSAQFGLAYYLGFLALVSISLGVLNILPVPVLDGGHLVYYLYEWCRGKPASLQAQMSGFRVGVVMIFGLMAVALYNDIARLVS